MQAICLSLKRRGRGEERALLPAAGLGLKTWQAGQGESFTPLAYDLPGRIQPGCDDIIGQTFIGEQDDFGADNVTIR